MNNLFLKEKDGLLYNENDCGTSIYLCTASAPCACFCHSSYLADCLYIYIYIYIFYVSPYPSLRSLPFLQKRLKVLLGPVFVGLQLVTQQFAIL